MKKQEQDVVIEAIQQDNTKIIVSNPLSVLKFNKQEGKNFIPVPTQEIGVFIPKVVWEIVSLLNNDDFNNIEGDTITKRIHIKDFLKRIRGDEKNYKYVIDAARVLRFWEIASINEKGQEVYRGFFNDVIHDKNSGYIDLKISVEWAKELLNIAINGNVSFLKQNIFDLQNSHAINIYPTLKAESYKGKYEVSLYDFKVKFGYNTSGYRFFNNLQSRVIEPAIDEINKKSTDLSVVFQADGTNLDGKRPKITNLIFWIKEKNKQKDIKQLPTGDHHQTAVAPQPEAPTEPKIKPIERAKPQATADKPSEAEIFELGKLLKLNEAEIQVVLQNFNYDYIEVWQRFKFTIGGIKDGTVKNKEKPLGFILSSPILGAGLWQAEKEKAQKRELERVEKEKQAIIQQIQTEYQNRKIKQFTELYNKATDETKQDFINDFKSQTKNGFNQYVNLQGEIKSQGIYTIGEAIAETKGIGLEKRQSIFRNEIFEKYSYQIGYDQNDQVLILGLFENIEQPPTTTEPQATAPQEPTQTAEQIQENKKRYQAQKRQPKPATAKTIEPQATEKTTPPPAIIQEPTKTEKPKTGIQKLFNFFN